MGSQAGPQAEELVVRGESCCGLGRGGGKRKAHPTLATPKSHVWAREEASMP